MAPNNNNQRSFHKQENNRYSPYPKFSNFKKSGKPKTKSLDLKELTSISKIKSKLRDTSRLLKKPNLASNVRTEIERKVTNLESLLKEREMEEKRKSFNEKNKGIMHIEKKKCLRSLKQLTKKLEEADQENEEELEKLEQSLFETNLNLNYIKYYPVTEDKYYPLFGSNQKGKALEMKESIKEQIKARMLSGEFDDDENSDGEEGQSKSKAHKAISKLAKADAEDKPKKNAILNDDFFAVGASNNDDNEVQEPANNIEQHNGDNDNDNDDDDESSESDDSESESDEESSNSSESENSE